MINCAHRKVVDNRNHGHDLRGLDKGQTQHIFTECVFNLAVHILPETREIHCDILRGWVVLPYREDGILRLIVADSELKELNAEVVTRQSAKKA